MNQGNQYSSSFELAICIDHTNTLFFATKFLTWNIPIKYGEKRQNKKNIAEEGKIVVM